MIDGQNLWRLIAATSSVSLSDCELVNGLAKGGDGGEPLFFCGGGGGGMGAGGALYIDRDQSVTLNNTSLSGNKAQGGNGGDATTTGGGQTGAGGGGASFSSVSKDGELINGGGDNAAIGPTGGAGDGTGTGYGGGAGGDGAFVGDGASGGGDGVGDGNPGNRDGEAGGYCGGGGGGGGTRNSGGGGGGNGGGDGGTSIGNGESGGGGGIGGGGAGGRSNGGFAGAFSGGGGGFGGGGGGGTGAQNNSGGGGGGFGGGGGGGGATNPASGGRGGFFGGDGNAGETSGQLGGAGGGGAGLGGAIFVGDGATLTLQGTFSITSNTVEGGSQGSGGTGGSDGTGFAEDVFLFREASLVFDTTNNVTASFSIQADQNAPVGHLDSGVIKQNTGTVTLSSTNDYRGATQVSAGTLFVTGDITESSGATASSGATLATSALSKLPGYTIDAGGTLELNISDSQTVATDFLSGSSGNFRKAGSGTLTLSASNTYTGSTTVSEGTLIVTDSISSNSTTTVAGNATLKGDGTIGSLIVNGNHAPGNSIGTMTVVGDVAYQAGSTLELEINALGQSDLVDVSGAVVIDNGATLEIDPETGSYQANTSYPFITSGGGITGNFGSKTITNPQLLAGLSPVVVIEGTSAVLYLLTSADDLTGLSMNAGMSTQIAESEVNFVKLIQNQRIIQNAPCKKSFCTDKEEKWPCGDRPYSATPYILVDYIGSKTKTKLHQVPFSNQMESFVLGSDFSVTEYAVVGLQGGYNHGHASSKMDLATLRSNSFYGAGYFQGDVHRVFYIDLAVVGGVSYYNLKRNATNEIQSTFKGYNFSFQMQLSRPVQLGSFYFEPILGSEYSHRTVGGFVENSGLNSLTVESFSARSATLDAGAAFWYAFCGESWKIFPEAFAIYTRRIAGNSSNRANAFYTSDPSTTFSEKQRNISLNSWRFGASLVTTFLSGKEFSVGYQRKVDSAYSSWNEAFINFEKKF